jgi:hypothetical protein
LRRWLRFKHKVRRELDWRGLVDVRFAPIATKFRIAPK